ncbi:MAG: serine hydrolase [Idiomarina sp.]|nr:serine hydrolase [Idiomarina sp.]
MSRLNPSDRESLDEYIERGREQWQIPGMAVGIVHNDTLIYAKGFGALGLEQDDAVNQDTLFGVASTSKAMTAASLAMLVDEGKLDWDDRVIEHLPYFQLSDPWVTHEVRIRDLLSHQVGVGRMTGNQIRFMPTASREAVIRQMRFHEFEASFRSRYVYSNVMYSVAGEIVAAVSGMSWDDFMAERLFQPLGMTRSNTSITQFAEDDRNIAHPHQYIEGDIVPIARRNFDNVGPSASVNTTVHDMAQWIRLQLGEPGVYQGQRLLSDEVMAEMHQAQVSLPRSDRSESLRAYGFGWSLGDYQGYATSSHGGATDGFNTSLTLVPELDLGIVVITNTFDGYRPAVVNEIVDRIAGLPQHDWQSHFYDAFQNRFEQAMDQRREIEQARQLDTTSAFTEAQMLGLYEDDLYGQIEVFRNDDGGLSLHFWNDGESLLDLEHWHHNTWRASYHNRAQREKFVYFSGDADGNVEALNIRFTLRPVMTQVGLYPTNYYRDVRFTPVE